MKIGYLILAHNTPHHLSRLVKALDGENSRFYIHVDRKADIRHFQKELSSPHAIFIKKRENVFWGEFSIITASLNLIKAALDHHEIDYLCLLSGACYPLRSLPCIEDFFLKNDRAEFMDTIEMPDPRINKSLERMEFYRINTPFKNILVRKLISRFNGLKLWRRDYKSHLVDLKPYAGSQWWAMTRQAAQYILDFIHSNPKFVRFFENTACADESFFQTIIGNSSFARNVKSSLTYADWSNPPFVSPATIGRHHMDILKSLNKESIRFLFARKFADNSLEFTQIIDKEIIGLNVH